MGKVMLVDSSDTEIGSIGKLDAHRGRGRLHRAFSVLIFDGDRMLLTQRSGRKRTWPLFWSNACCSHPVRGEDCVEGGRRRLREELGFDCALTYLFKFEYQADFNGRYGEHEIDWVFAGEYSGPIQPNRAEVRDYAFVTIAELRRQVAQTPERFTPWLRIIMAELPRVSPPLPAVARLNFRPDALESV